MNQYVLSSYTMNEKVSALKKLEGGGLGGGGGDNRMSENSVCVSYFFLRFIPLHGGA